MEEETKTQKYTEKRGEHAHPDLNSHPALSLT